MATNGSSDQLCVSTCCDRQKLYTPESSCYRNASVAADPETIFPEIYDSNLSIINMSSNEFGPRYGKPCPGNTICYTDSNSVNSVLIYLLDNGRIYTNESIGGGLAYSLGKEDYCFTSHITENGTKSVMSVCESYFDSVSFHTAQSHYTTVQNDKIFYTTMTCLSLPFLVATFLVYTILPELKNLHGLIIRTYIACSCVVTTLNIIPDTYFHGGLAYLEANILIFSMLATFFWLNVMSFDIWWTFRSLQNSLKQQYRKKLIIYSIYAWGCSAVITVALIEGSWINGTVVNPIYIYVIVGVTIICNMCFFLLTAIKIIQEKKDTAHHLEGGDNRRHNEAKQRFNVYLKLFLIMGTTWSVEIVGFLWEDLPDTVSYIIELPNMLQGVAIFIIFVCNNKIKMLLLKRLGCMSGRPSLRHTDSNTTTTSTTSTTSNI